MIKRFMQWLVYFRYWKLSNRLKELCRKQRVRETPSNY